MILVRLVAPFTIVFVFLILLCFWLGGILPPNPSVMAGNPCRLPCVFDIVPGSTDLGDALRVMRQLAPDDHQLAYGHSLRFRIRDDNNRAVQGEVMFIPRGLVVGAARISTAGSRAHLWRLGDMLAAGMQPTRVFRACNAFTPRLLLNFGDDIEVIIELRRMDSLRPDAPITLIHVSTADASTLYHARADFGCRVEIGWRGFAPRWVYLQAQDSLA